MKLTGQEAQRGYAMAMLIIAIGVMTILWSAALPAWSQLAKREKESELIFRGEQYARAIRLFQQRYANAYPPSLDVLVDQKFLRRKYEDPMVEDGEFQLLYLTSQEPGVSGRGGAGTGGLAGGLRGGARPTTGTPLVNAGIIGVTSKSTETALREYNGAEKYNEWRFVPVETTLQPGTGLVPTGPAGGDGGIGLPGGRGTGQPPTGGPFGRGGRGPGGGGIDPEGRDPGARPQGGRGR